MHRFAIVRHVCIRTAYICVYAYCVIRMRNMYTYNNYVRIQQLCTRTTIMYAYNNYVRVKRSTLADVSLDAQTYPHSHTSYSLEKSIAPPEKS